MDLCLFIIGSDGAAFIKGTFLKGQFNVVVRNVDHDEVALRSGS